MTPGKLLPDEVHGWLVKAAEDLLMAQLAIRNGLPESTVYHCQQAAEKSLKAFLTFHQAPFRKTHLLEELGEACRAIDPGLPRSVQEGYRLTEYAWMFRYPGAPRELDPGEAEEALRLAQAVNQAILSRLPQEVRP